MTILPIASSAQGNLENDFIVEDNSHLMGKMTTIGDAPWQVVYLNFEGAQLQQGQSDAPNNSTSLAATASLAYPAQQSWSNWGGKDAGIKAIVDKLKVIFGTVAVKFVITRPTSGNYTMAMIGGNGTGSVAGGSAIGVAPLDCKNVNKNDIVFIFGDKIASGGSPSITIMATTIAHELGHSFGLDHITDKGGIMYPQALGATQWAKSKSAGDAKCNKTDQDAAKVLQDNLGVGKQDKLSPKLWFKRPGSGAVLPPDFSWEVTAGDDLGVHHVTVYVDGKKQIEGTDPPFTGILRGVAEGEHTLKAEAADWLGNKAETTIKVTVKKACVGEGSCHGGTGGIDAPCTSGGECISGVCALKDGAGVCVDTCDASAEDPVCPAGLTCKKAGEQDACLPGDGYTLSMSDGDDGGCRVGPGSSSGAGALARLPLLGILALLGLAWRRR